MTVPSPPRRDGCHGGTRALLRRGPFSGAGWQPAGDLRFRRQERVRVEIPVLGAFTASATRLLDRNGNRLDIPVAPLRGRIERRPDRRRGS